MSGVEAANAAIAIRCYPRKLLRSRAASFILSPLNGNKASDLAHLPRAPYLFFSSKMQTTYKESARITTVKGVRTSFFSPNLDRLFLAVRRQGRKLLQSRSLFHSSSMMHLVQIPERKIGSQGTYTPWNIR